MKFLIALTALLLCAQLARADCTSGDSSFAAGLCEAQTYSNSAAALNHAYQLLYLMLPASAQAALRQEQLAWAAQRDKASVEPGKDGIFINFGRATQLTQARLAVLKARLGQPIPVVTYNGRYSVLATAMPWLWEAGDLNSAYPFGKQDGTGPVVLTLAGLHAAPGQMLVLRYISGQIVTGTKQQPSDADGPAGASGDGAKLPGSYIRPHPARAGALIGAFTDANGQLLGAPIALGNGPDQAIIPAGAAQLQLGMNDEVFSGNTGSLTISVTVAPAQAIMGAAAGLHGCAVFGGSAAGCQNYPAWISGLWLPPAGSGKLHVLAVGGGGGGGAGGLIAGLGGSGGSSGEVINTIVPILDQPISVQAGQKGIGVPEPGMPANPASASVFGPVIASGGSNGSLRQGGTTPGSGGSNGGGGGGGGTYETTFDAGRGGSGGAGGSPGIAGHPASDTLDGMNGAYPGNGAQFPTFDFNDTSITAGAGGIGGGFGTGGQTPSGSNCAGGGGGGGGGGGVLLNNAGPPAQTSPKTYSQLPCGTPGQTGEAGFGYGAGGGGTGEGQLGIRSEGAGGVVYVEW